MAGETQITVIGNLTNDPELRFTPSGSAVSNFTLASTPRTFNRQTNGWEDGETLFLRASVWREAAENVAETLKKGMRVIASGRLKSRQYETKEGEKRTVIELEIDEIGPSLRYANATVNRTQRGNQQQGNGNDYAPAQGGYSQQQPPQGNGQWGGQPQGQQPPQQGGFGGGQWAQGGPNQYAQQPQGQQRPATQPATQQHPDNTGGYGYSQADDPWATPGVSDAASWGNGPANEPPF
jgi:single-strand DNA-binding protein